MPDDPASVSTDRIEERFLASLKVRPFPTSDLLDMLIALHVSGHADRLGDCLVVLQHAFVEEGDIDGLARLLALRVEWGGDKDAKEALAKDLKEVLPAAAHKNRLHAAMVDSFDWEKDDPGASLRALRNLLLCVPGAFCLDKTWGFGVIKRLDGFYKRVIVDFENRKGHALSFAHAAGTLRILEPGHILAVFHNDPKAFLEKTKTAPDEVVLHALRSFGPMSVTHIEDQFAKHGLLPKGTTWKTFWTAARARLKSNPTVRIPPATKKNEPIVLLTRAVSFADDNWFEDLSGNNDAADILARASAIESKGIVGNLSAANVAILSERLQFAYKAACTRSSVQTPALETHGDTAVNNDSRYKHWLDGVRQGRADMARAALLASKLKLADIPVADWIHDMAKPGFLFDACLKMSGRDLADFAELLPLRDDPNVAVPFVDNLETMPYALLEVVMPSLLRGVAAQETRVAVATAFGKSSVPFPLLLWIARHQNEEDVRQIVPPATVAATCLIALEMQTSGEELRLFHLIARCFEDAKWVSDLMIRMDDDGRQALYDRVHGVDKAWEPAKKRAIIAAIVKEYPGLAQPRAAEESAPEAAPRLTSWRSYHDRQEQRRRLVEEEIPKNAHDIDVARGYGDLRENFEYQTAKDTQRLLLQRQAELNEQLAIVKGTDFAGVPTDKVAMGTLAILRFADGSSESYSVLGEWDSDEALHIVPCRSRIAEILLDKVPGAEVDLPSLSGAPRHATLEAVQPLPEAVRAWIDARP